MSEVSEVVRTQPNEDLKAVLKDWGTQDTIWGQVAREYSGLDRERFEVDRILDSLHPDVDDLLSEVRREERRNLELQVAKANKTSPKDVTEEMFLSFAEVLSDEAAELRRIARASSKKYGRPLLQTLHPDKGGDPQLFDIVKKAVQAGDTDLLRLFLYNLKGVSEDPSEVLRRITGRRVRLRGSRVHRICRMCVFGARESAVVELRSLLSSRLEMLKRLNTPGAFNDQP
jgi:hypothetical protein